MFIVKNWSQEPPFSSQTLTQTSHPLTPGPGPRTAIISPSFKISHVLSLSLTVKIHKEVERQSFFAMSQCGVVMLMCFLKLTFLFLLFALLYNYCSWFSFCSGKVVTFKIKYDQKYNTVHPLCNANNEVYTSPVIERLMWLLGMGSDISIPVSLNCIGCPVEPWTYVKASCGIALYDLYHYDMSLLLSGRWKEKVSSLHLPYTLAYIDWDDYVPAVKIYEEETSLPGWSWSDLGSMKSQYSQSAERDAMTIFAALISHVDNKQVNQRLNCLLDHSSSSSSESGDAASLIGNCSPYMFLHDVGCTLGYGMNLWTGDLTPNVLDLERWLSVSESLLNLFLLCSVFLFFTRRHARIESTHVHTQHSCASTSSCLLQLAYLRCVFFSFFWHFLGNQLSIWSDKKTCTVKLHGLVTASFRDTWKVTIHSFVII